MQLGKCVYNAEKKQIGPSTVHASASQRSGQYTRHHFSLLFTHHAEKFPLVSMGDDRSGRTYNELVEEISIPIGWKDLLWL